MPRVAVNRGRKPGGTDPNPREVDNITGDADGNLFVAEDGGNLEINVMTPNDIVAPFLRVTGQSGSEICGPAFSPNGTRFYFSSYASTRRLGQS